MGSKRDTRNDERSRGTIKRQGFFDAYSRNLEIYAPEYRGLFGCPICLQGFPRIETSTNGKLTIEHCVPSTLGGTLETMTCKKCNNSHGSKYDAQLVRWREYEDYCAGLMDKPIRTVVTAGEAKLPATLTRDGKAGPIHLAVTSQRADPQEIVKAEAYFNRLSTHHKEIKFTHQTGLRDEEYKVAMLRSAYLIMFSWFGYGYILHKPLERVRRQILDSKSKLIPNPVVCTSSDNRKTKNVVCIVAQPRELRCFLVMVRLATKYSSKTHGVILPGFDDDPDSIFDRWQASTEFQRSKIDCKKLSHDPKFLTDQIFGLPNYIYEHAMGLA